MINTQFDGRTSVALAAGLETWVMAMATRLSLFPRKLCYGRGSVSNFRYDKLLTYFRLCRVVRLFAYTASLCVWHCVPETFHRFAAIPKERLLIRPMRCTVVWPHPS